MLLVTDKMMNNLIKRWVKDFKISIIEAIEMARKHTKICLTPTSLVISELVIKMIMRCLIRMANMKDGQLWILTRMWSS